MNPGPFPKPPPAKPLSEQRWIRQADRAEVGRQPFFCGRDTEYEVFRNAAISLRDGDTGGGTMVFQGAPGAGKSALMLECMEAVRLHSTPQDPWIAVSIDPGTLSYPVDVVSDLIHAANEETQRLSKLAPDSIADKFNQWLDLGRKLYAELSSRGVSVAGFSVGGKPQTNGRSDSVQSSGSVFRKTAVLLENFHIVVFVDEAQNTPESTTTKAVLDSLHRDPKGIPLVAAFFGLSDTKDVLRRCGLSRLASQRIVNLDPLPLTDAKFSIRHMIDTYYTGTEVQKENWTNALAELSQGWPQHINRTGIAAGLTLAENNTEKLESHLLEHALEKANELKNEYYEQRVESGGHPAWVYRQIALSANEKRSQHTDVLSYNEIELLTESARKKRNETIDEFITDALHAGLLSPVKGMLDHYKIPIPSLGDYLRSAAVEPVVPD